MNKIISLIGLSLLLLFTGCVQNHGVAYDADNHKAIKSVSVGKIVNIRDAYIKDSGSGKIIGGIIGGVLGSTIGKGSGSILAGLGGAVMGGMLGNKLNETNAQELTVLLDNGKTVVVLSKGTLLKVGNKIRIVSVGNEVSTVYKI